MKKRSSPIQKIALSLRIILDFCFAVDSVDNKQAGRKEGEKKEFVARLQALLNSVNRLNQKGVMLKVTWSISAGSSYDLLQKLAPHLLEDIKTRVAVGYDEINDYSRNEALMPMMTGRELQLLNSATKDNPFVRLAEPYMPMAGGAYSPELLPYLTSLGINGISFNVNGLDSCYCTDLVGNLPFAQRYNPTWLTKTASNDKTILIPSLSIIDVINEGGLRKMILNFRNEQVKHPKIHECLLLFDEYISSSLMFDNDADWESPSYCYLEEEIDRIAMLPFLIFTTPSQYVKRNPPRGLLVIDRDLVSSSLGGNELWADKWENRVLWSHIERTRLYCDKALSVSKGSGRRRLAKSVEEKVVEIESKLVKLLGENYFGPNYITDRINYVEMGIAKAQQIEESASLLLLSVSEQAKDYKKALTPEDFKMKIKKDSDNPFKVGENYIQNNLIRVEHHPSKGVLVTCKEIFNAQAITTRFAIVRNGKLLEDFGHLEYISAQNGVAQMIVSGSLVLRPKMKAIKWKYIYSLLEGKSQIYFNVQVDFPDGDALDKMGVGGTPLDLSLDELLPAEISLPEIKVMSKPFLYWRDSVLTKSRGGSPVMEIDKPEMASLLENQKQMVLNSQFVNRWIGVGINGYGLIVAQKKEEDQSFSFCPIKFSRRGNHYFIKLNPMGIYAKEAATHSYKKAKIGLLYRKWRREKRSYGASYGGKKLSSTLIFSPFKGTTLPESELDEIIEYSTDVHAKALKDREFDITG